MKLTNKKGFTLVELVIVIAVIAILAAVLIPTFSNIVNSANENAAMQNARTALTDYVSSLGANVPEHINLVIKSTQGTTAYYFHVNDGQLNTSPLAAGAVALENKTLTYDTTEYTLVEENNTTALFNGCEVYAK